MTTVQYNVDPALVKETMERYGLNEHDATISADRRRVYGDPKVNHDGIAFAWAGLLQPWAHNIAALKPLPAHVVALCMCAVKLNRQRMVFHADNADDMNVYQAFARAWQKEYDGPKPEVLGPPPSPDSVLVIEWRTPTKRPILPPDNYDRLAAAQSLRPFQSEKFTGAKLVQTEYPNGPAVTWVQHPAEPVELKVNGKTYDLVERTS
jgi:hypothetical protein